MLRYAGQHYFVTENNGDHMLLISDTPAGFHIDFADIPVTRLDLLEDDRYVVGGQAGRLGNRASDLPADRGFPGRGSGSSTSLTIRMLTKGMFLLPE